MLRSRSCVIWFTSKHQHKGIGLINLLKMTQQEGTGVTLSDTNRETGTLKKKKKELFKVFSQVSCRLKKSGLVSVLERSCVALSMSAS